MFIVLITYKVPLTIIDQHLAAHRDHLKQCYAKQQLLASGPQNPRTGGVLISPLTVRAEIETLIAQDPFHRNNLADYQIIEFSPVLHDPQFAPFCRTT